MTTIGSNLKDVNAFTDLRQITADYLWDSFDMHYNCVDTLPCYVSPDWELIISPMYDIIMAGETMEERLNCWCFEWGVIGDADPWGCGMYDTLAEYCLPSPWEAFRVALKYRDAYLAGDFDNCTCI